MTDPSKRRLAWILGLTLVALHLGFEPPASERLLFDALPVELAWRLAWMAGAAAYVVWITGALWNPEDERGSAS